MLSPNNTNQINSYKIDLANIYKLIQKRNTYTNTNNVEDIKLMANHLSLLIAFVNVYFKTGFLP